VAGRTLGVSVQTFSVPTPDAVASQLVAMARARVQGVVVGPTPVPRTRQKEIVEFVAKNRLPAIYGGRDYVDAGGLMSYNPNRPDMGRQAAAYVDKILLASGLSHREPSESNRAKIQPTATAGLTGSSPWVTVA
jgi:putative tryptophan/tyrosine transport system substrate-binding protein